MTTEAVIDAVEETVDTLERIPKLALNGTTRQQQVVILSAVAGSAAVASGLVVHYLTRKILGLKFEDLLEEELEKARRHYVVLNANEGVPESPLEALEQSGVILREGGYIPVETPVESEEQLVEEVVNIFTQSANDLTGDQLEWDQLVEQSKRTEDEPFVISKDEFDAGEADYDQESLVYYAGDDVLTDSNGHALDPHEVDITVGEGNLLRFGHGSGNHSIVYVRNPRLELDYEVVENRGNYARQVAGYIEHSDGGGKPRKMRRFDG